jgi:hypothetical protein
MEAIQHDIVGFLSGASGLTKFLLSSNSSISSEYLAILLSMEQIAQNTLSLCPPQGAMRVLCDQQAQHILSPNFAVQSGFVFGTLHTGVDCNSEANDG